MLNSPALSISSTSEVDRFLYYQNFLNFRIYKNSGLTSSIMRAELRRTFLPAIATVLVLMIVLEPVNVAGWSCWAAPVTFGPKCRSNLAVLGHKGHKISYNVKPNNNMGPLICCEGKGFNSKAKAIWRGIGCGHKSMGATLTWGNVAAYPEIRCKGVPTGSVVNWSH